MLVHTAMYMSEYVLHKDGAAWPRMLQNPKIFFPGCEAADPDEAYRAFIESIPLDSPALESYLGPALKRAWGCAHDTPDFDAANADSKSEDLAAAGEIREMVAALERFYDRRLAEHVAAPADPDPNPNPNPNPKGR
mmetsp:Transcript_46041/g.144080  ORF Transcript_46041/g.144080 Transcript_46041/m.144080 type:complete len:136 (-) Transcript_46041:101-508(-)